MNSNVKTSVLIFFLVVLSPQMIRAEESQNPTHPQWLHGFRGGLLAHDIRLWSRTRSEGGVDLNAEVVFSPPGWTLFNGKILSNLGFSLNSQGDTSSVYTGLLWEFEPQSRFFFNVGLGLALHDGEFETGIDNTKALGSRILFRIPIEVGLLFAKHHGVSILLVHVSNAYLADPNEGLDTFGIRYSYRF
jgi:hypothetical protein